MLNDEKYIQCQEVFTANSVFQGKVKIFLIQYIQPVKAITLMFLVRENTTRKELHRLELTSKVTTGVNKQGNYLPIMALLWDYISNVIAELKL